MLAPKLRFKEFNNEWKKERLNKISTINPKSDNLPNKFIYIDLESVQKGNLLNKNIINKIHAPSRAQRTVKLNDILFQTVRPYQQNNYFVSEVCDIPYIASTGYALIRTNQDPYFIYTLMHRQDFLNKVLDMCTGTSFPAINSNDLGTIEIKIPLKKEQEKISELFSLLNKKIELQQRKIEVLKMYKKGLERKVFNTLSKSTNNKIITEIADTFIGLVTTMTEHYVENGVRLIRNSDIKENQFIFNDDIFLDENFANKNCNRKHIIGDIVTVHTGDVGTSSIIDEKLNGSIGFATIVTRVKNNEIANNKYICWYYNSSIYKNIIKNIITGDGRNNLNMKDFNKIKIPLPSIEQQEKISNIFENIKSKIVSCEKEYKVLIKYKKYLLQQMFI